MQRSIAILHEIEKLIHVTTEEFHTDIAASKNLNFFQAYKSLAARKSLTEAKPAGLQDLSYDQLFFIGYAQVTNYDPVFCRNLLYQRHLFRVI